MDNGTGSKIIAGVALVLAIAAGGGTFTEYNTAKDLTAQLNSATADVQRLREQLAAATADAQQAHTQASAEQQLLVKEARPDLPITMGFRPSLLGNGKVAVIQNISNGEIEVTLDVLSPATGLTFHRALVIEPHRVQQLGKSEGWEFATGQQVRLNNPKYRPAGWTVGG
jgi:outer membrane murein-binding lipoprotein Lpp